MDRDLWVYNYIWITKKEKLSQFGQYKDFDKEVKKWKLWYNLNIWSWGIKFDNIKENIDSFFDNFCYN